MVMSFNEALIMPSNYAVMSEDEMCYVEGGSHNVTLNKGYLIKNNCLAEAGKLLERHMISGMTKLQIAKEIYAHAVVKYALEALPKSVREMSGVKGIYSSAADGAYIADGGDTATRQAFYNAVWAVL